MLLAAQVVNFLILLFILKKFLYGPILKVLKTRKDKIAGSLKNAEEIERKLQEIGEKEAESILRSAKEGEKIIKQSGEIGAGIIADATAEYERIIKKAVEDRKQLMLSEKASFEQGLKRNLSYIIALTFEKIMGKPLHKEQKEFLEDIVRRMK